MNKSQHIIQMIEKVHPKNKISNDDVIPLVKEALDLVYSWPVRDKVARLTSWGFWTDEGGEEELSVNERTATKVLEALLSELQHYCTQKFLMDVYNMFKFLKDD